MCHKAASVLLPLSLILGLVLAPASETALAGDSDLRVLSSDSNGLTMELVTPSPRMSTARGADGLMYDRVRVPGWASTTSVGRPELPVRGVLIHVPTSGEIDVEIEESAWQSLPGLRVLPVAGPGATEDGAARDQAAYGHEGFLPETHFDLSARSLLRGVPVRRLTLYPFQWNAATGDLRYATRIIVRVLFREPLPSAAAGASAERGPTTTMETPGGALMTNGVKHAGEVRLRMEVQEDGLYRITYHDLVKAGVRAQPIDPRTLQVFNRGREVAIQVFSKSGRVFAGCDYLEFYAQGLRTTFTDTNVYWLCFRDQLGERIATTDGRVIDGSELVAAFPEQARFEENHTMWESMPGAPEQDYWFWEKLQAPATRNFPVTIPSPAKVDAEAILRVGLRGKTTLGHRLLLLLNGVPVGDKEWSGTGENILELEVPQGLLAAGVNEFRIEMPGGADVDIVYLNWIDVDYQRTAHVAGNELRLSLSGGGRAIQVSGLTKSTARVYDISDPCRPRILLGPEVTTDGAGYKVRFGTESNEAGTYYVLTEEAVRTPAAMAIWSPDSLTKPAAGADYILITPREFLAAAEPLCALRRQQGLRVRTAAVEDIYNAYGDGLPDPAAVKAFLTDAYLTWERPAPAYVFLLGDANTDYRDYFGTGKKNRVPVHLSATSGLGVTPDDNWYASVDGADDLPDLCIGRVTVSTAQAAAAVVSKIVGYEQQPAATEALFVADNDEVAFQDLTEKLAASLPSGIAARDVYLRAYSDSEIARQDLRDSLNNGTVMTTYVGHGSVTAWAGERLLDTATIPLLNNDDRLTFAVTLTCLNGYFSQPFYYSIGELLVNMPEKGAIASFSPSGLGYTWEHDILGTDLFEQVSTNGQLILGRLTTDAKINAYAKGATLDLVKTFTLLGDPASRLAMP